MPTSLPTQFSEASPWEGSASGGSDRGRRFFERPPHSFDDLICLREEDRRAI